MPPRATGNGGATPCVTAALSLSEFASRSPTKRGFNSASTLQAINSSMDLKRISEFEETCCPLRSF